MESPDTGQPVNVTHIRPRSMEDLQRRRAASKRIADASVGMMGRTPDYLNYTFACFAARADVWGRYGNEEGAANLVAYANHMRDNDLSLTHTLINPQVDRSVAEADQAQGEVSLQKVGDTENGIVVRGARMLATLAPFADELAVYPGGDLRLQDSKYAICFSIPMATPGLKFICRDSFSSQGDPVGLPALDALRRDGRGRDLRRRRDPARPDLPGRRRAAPHGGHHRLALARAHHPPGHDARLGEARVRVRARPHARRPDRREPVRPRAGEARRALVDDGDDPRGRDRRRGRVVPGRRRRTTGFRTSARSSRCAGSCRSGFRARSSCSS